MLVKNIEKVEQNRDLVKKMNCLLEKAEKNWDVGKKMNYLVEKSEKIWNLDKIWTSDTTFILKPNKSNVGCEKKWRCEEKNKWKCEEKKVKKKTKISRNVKMLVKNI